MRAPWQPLCMCAIPLWGESTRSFPALRFQTPSESSLFHGLREAWGWAVESPSLPPAKEVLGGVGHGGGVCSHWTMQLSPPKLRLECQRCLPAPTLKNTSLRFAYAVSCQDLRTHPSISGTTHALRLFVLQIPSCTLVSCQESWMKTIAC